MLAGGFFLFFLLFFGLGVLGMVMTIVAVIDMAKRPEWQWKIAGQEKVLWIVLAVVINAFAIVSLIYWFNIRNKLLAIEQAAAEGRLGPGFMTIGGWQPGPFAQPQPPPAPAPGYVGAQWFPDPSGEHRLRWWDGNRWTDHVLDDNQPPPAAPTA